MPGTAPATFPATPARSPRCSGTASACSRRRSSAPRCSTSTWCSRSSRARSSRNVDAFLAPNGFDATIDPAIVAEFAHTVYRFGHSMLTETIDRLDPEFRVERDRPDRGVPQSARVRRERHADARGGGRRHRARRHPPGRQRDRRVRHRGAAQQPARPAARPRRDQHRARPRHRHSVAERGAPRILRHDRRQPAHALHELGRLRAAPEAPGIARSTSSPPTARMRPSPARPRSRTSARRPMAIVFGGAGAPADRLDFLNSTGAWASGPRRRDHHRPRQRRLLDRRPGRGEDAVRRHARLDLQLRVRDAARGAAERRPVLLPGPPRRHSTSSPSWRTTRSPS